MGPPTMFTIPVLRYMKTYGVSEEHAMVCVVQREPRRSAHARTVAKEPLINPASMAQWWH